MNFDDLLTLDKRASTKMRIAEDPGILKTLSAILAHSGDSWFWLAGLAFVYFRAALAWKERAYVMIIAILITAVIVMVIKFTVRRSRPEGDWGNMYRKTDPHSFPSGHAARALMLAVLSFWLGPVWFILALVFWAPLVGLARVAMGVHYLSDIIAGGILGGLLGVLMGVILVA